MHRTDIICHDRFDMFHLPVELQPISEFAVPESHQELEVLWRNHPVFATNGDEWWVLKAILRASITYQRWIGTGARLLWWQFDPRVFQREGDQPIGTIHIGRQLTSLSEGTHRLTQVLQRLVAEGWISEGSARRPTLEDKELTEVPCPVNGLPPEQEHVYYVTNKTMLAYHIAKQQYARDQQRRARDEQAAAAGGQLPLFDDEMQPTVATPKPAISNGSTETPRKPGPLWLQPDLLAEDGAILYQPKQLVMTIPSAPVPEFVDSTLAYIDSQALSPVAILVIQEMLRAALRHRQWCWLTLPNLATILRGAVQSIPPEPGSVATPLLRTNAAISELLQRGMIHKLTCRFLGADNRPPHDPQPELEAYCITSEVVPPHA